MQQQIQEKYKVPTPELLPLETLKIPALPLFRLDAMQSLSPDDQIRFQAFGRGTNMVPRFATIHEGFDYFAASQPNAIAVEHKGHAITYGELNRQANKLAGFLDRAGVGQGDAVGLYLQRSIPMVVGILATLKIGAAYVPQHVGVVPEKTLRHISQVTGSKVILTISPLADQVPVNEGQVLLSIDDVMQASLVPFNQEKMPFVSVHPDSRCFILFTSGTTGVPNGVQVTHRNVCNILQTSPGDLGIKPGMRVAQMLSISFDMSAWEVLGCLSNGGTLIIRGKDFHATAEDVDVIIATPSILGSLDAKRCQHIKVVAVAGEPCPRFLADTWSAFCNFYNSCGPTETTIINTAERHFPNKDSLTIGRPTPNNTVYILDENMKPCPIGVQGEMWAGGDCVTAGYIGNPDLTADRYRPDPFLGEGRFMFRTRDLGRWTRTGELEPLGRVDDQVKVRGFRVELDSVTNVLEDTPDCRQAVTLKYDSRNLVAFVSPANVCTQTARDKVAEALPYYCTPAFVVAMDSLPVTARGKLDKRLLLELAQDYQKTNNVELA